MTKMIENGFIINPYHELLPDYKICPFSTTDIAFNRALDNSDIIDDYLSERFRDGGYCYTSSGREAIQLALSSYGLRRADCVTIITTTGNFYISSCVMREIEKVCSWSRSFELNTRLILVNHEFGYPFKEWESLLHYKLPIIEDCAHSFFTKDEHIGKIGDYVIYSFPKMFPVQFGGLLVANRDSGALALRNCGVAEERYLKNVLSYYIQRQDSIIQSRLENYDLLKMQIEPLGCSERFEMSQEIVPGVFLFNIDNPNISLPALKEHMYAHGIQCSVFYGENAFYIPVHQNLNKPDIDYICEVIKYNFGSVESSANFA